MKTFGMLLLVALSASPALAQPDDQKMSVEDSDMSGNAGNKIRGRVASNGRFHAEGVTIDCGAMRAGQIIEGTG